MMWELLAGAPRHETRRRSTAVLDFVPPSNVARAQAEADASAAEADKSVVDAARVQLHYADIAAPINACTGGLKIDLGNLVKANDTPYLMQLNQVTSIYVTIRFCA